MFRSPRPPSLPACRIILCVLLAAACPAAGPAAADQAQTPLRVALPEGLSPRTIGYFLARENGFFAAAGLDVRLETPASGGLADLHDPLAALTDNAADLAVEIMPVALRQREGGSRIVNVAQIFQKASMELVCRASIQKATAIRGHAVGVWFGGLESGFFAWMSQLNFSIFGGADGVTVLRQDRDLGDFERFQIDCVTTATYLAPIQFAVAGMNLGAMTRFRYETLGLGVLEDGLYATEADLAQPAKVAAFAAFLRAANRGWELLHTDRGAAVRLLQKDPAYKTVDAKVLLAALAEADALVSVRGVPIGSLVPADYDRTVNLLLTGAPNPVLRRAPAAAFSDIVWRRMRQG